MAVARCLATGSASLSVLLSAGGTSLRRGFVLRRFIKPRCDSLSVYY